MPVEDRAADTWEPLMRSPTPPAVTGRRRAGPRAGRWWTPPTRPTRTRTRAARRHPAHLHRGAEAFLASADLVAELRGIEESPWDDFELTASKLAYRYEGVRCQPGFQPRQDSPR